ncbi:MAG TPA: hypothetical protein VFV67_35245 [Actinophytocola sp.]|uniref:hypothetical protein n=1 Tax=Actinophytocola sp. TaxID=1872138 RepID=UPI002DB75EC3|nr:hypothetical protein [Actinophytocola sp.]HEU5475911.1 hypothetical protein [Actinophytocola sp.]
MSEAAEVGKSAAERAGEVSAVVGEQAKQVASETGTQAKNLLEEGANQLRGQASDAQQKLAEGLHGMAEQLRRMSDRSDDSGVASDLVRQATERTEQVASWLKTREPGDLIGEVRSFARRRPGVFLAGAAVAGLLAGRLTRNIAASAKDSGPDRRETTPSRPAGAEQGWRTERPAPGDTDRALGAVEQAPTGAGPARQVRPGPVASPAGASVTNGPGPVRR